MSNQVSENVTDRKHFLTIIVIITKISAPFRLDSTLPVVGYLLPGQVFYSHPEGVGHFSLM